MIDIMDLLIQAESDEEANMIYDMDFTQLTRHVLQNMDYYDTMDEPVDPDGSEEYWCDAPYDPWDMEFYE